MDETDNRGAFLQLAPDAEFVAWAFSVPRGYYDDPDRLRRMNGWVLRTMVTPGAGLERTGRHGTRAIELDRLTGCGWRFVCADGEPRTAWFVSADRGSALGEAWACAQDLDGEDALHRSAFRGAMSNSRIRLVEPHEDSVPVGPVPR